MSREMIDEKLSELCAQLETLGSLKEKTAALKDVTRNLASIGDDRVHQVENTLTAFSVKTKATVNEVGQCIAKLDNVLQDIKQVPLIEELRGIRENVTSNLKSMADGVELVEERLSDRITLLNNEIAELAGSLSRNSTEVTNIKRNVSDYATQTKDGLTELDTTVRDRTGELDTKFDKGQSRQASDIKQMKKQIADDIEGSKAEISESVFECKEAVETCQKYVSTIRTLAIVTLIALIGFMIATSPLIKVAWVGVFK